MSKFAHNVGATVVASLIVYLLQAITGTIMMAMAQSNLDFRWWIAPTVWTFLLTLAAISMKDFRVNPWLSLGVFGWLAKQVIYLACLKSLSQATFDKFSRVFSSFSFLDVIFLTLFAVGLASCFLQFKSPTD